MSEKQYDFRQLLSKAMRHWHLFAIFFILSLVAAYVFLKYTQPKYESTAMLLIKDKGEEGHLNEELVFSELGLGKKNKNLENEVLVLKSTPLMYEVVKKLELQYQFTEIDGIKRSDLYRQSPIQVLDWQPAEQGGEIEGELYLNEPEGYRLVIEEQEFSGSFGNELELPYGKLNLMRTAEKGTKNPIEIHVASPWNTAQEFVKEFNVEVMGQHSSVLFLTFKDGHPERAKDVLRELIDVYNLKTVEEKNRVYKNTIAFIDERIQLIAGELSETESDVENYKRQHNVVELSNEGNMIQSELNSYDKEISNKEVQLEILNTIQAFLLKNQKDFEFVPSNLNLTNLTLTNQLDKFNQLLSQREQLKYELGKSHPDLILTEKQLYNLRQTIINNIHSIKKDLQITSGAEKELQANLKSRLQSLPKRERELVDIERKKNIKENLYVYLLEKREESAISLAVTAATGTMVEPPEVSDPVSPKEAQVWLIAAFLGLAIPAGIVLLLENLNDKVYTEEEVRKAVPTPVVGVLGVTKKKEKLVVRENNPSRAAEMFRLLRANLAYVTPGKEIQSVLITSVLQGEGKSYIALNLAMAQAMTDRKVIIVDVDLRNPEQETYTRTDPAKVGVVDYLVNPSVTIDSIIRNSHIHPGLDIISRGPRIADPSKMILSFRLRELINRLKERYDFIILDAPPVGTVADTLEMKDLAEATMFVVRAGFTRQPHLQILNDIARKGKLLQPFVVLNGVPLKKLGWYGYHHDFSNGFKNSQRKMNGAVPAFG